MNFYEQTIVAKHDLTAKDLDNLQDKYSKIITDSSGKVLKLENWGLISFLNIFNISRNISALALIPFLALLSYMYQKQLIFLG